MTKPYIKYENIKYEKEVQLTEKHIKFYKGLKREQLENISSEKIDEIERFAYIFSKQKRGDLKYRFASAIEKSYLGYNNNLLTLYLPKGKVQRFIEELNGDIITLSFGNDAEVLLFIMFATDPDFLLLKHSANKRTIEEMKNACQNYAYFWDLQLLITEQKFTKLLLSRQSDLLEKGEDFLTNNSDSQNRK